jgi:hypothetical protein
VRPATTLLASILACAACSALAGSDARADDAAVCLDAHTRGQRLRKQSKLLDARAALLRCAAGTCPGMVTTDCSTWVTELAREVPSVVVALRDEAGREVADARVRIDGRLTRARIDGRPIELDPGVHRVVVDSAAGTVEQSVVLATGQQNRVVSLTLPDDSGRGALRTAAWISGGVGLAGLASFAAFAISGQVSYDELEACRPGCPQGDEDSVATRFVVADVSLGVGIAGVAGAIVLWLVSRPPRGRPASGGTVDLAPQLGPRQAGAALHGSF